MATSCHTSVSVSLSHFSLSSLPGLILSLSLCPLPLQTLTSSDVSSFFADFSFCPSSPMYILYPCLLPLLYTHICTHPSAVTYTHTPQQWWPAFSRSIGLSPEHLLRYMKSTNSFTRCVCVCVFLSFFHRLLMLCLQTHICVSCNRLPVYAVSFNLLMNECVSSVDLAAHGHMRFHPLCDGLLI